MPMKKWPRHDARTRKVGAPRVEVYRRDDRLVQGPAMSLYLDGREAMRWDLQPGIAHVHWAVGSAPRLYFPREWGMALVLDLACDQLRQHAQVVARMAGLPQPESGDLATVAQWARGALREQVRK